MWFMALLFAALAAGCGGGGGGGGAPILGAGGAVSTAIAPTVTAIAPLNNATGVPINNTIITANFSEPMAPITGAASFTVTCAAPCVNPTGTVTLDATNRIATYTAAANLTPLTLYTATVTGAKSLATGLALVSPYVWHFTTGLVADTVKPQVLSTFPATTVPGPTLAIPTNTAITATFTKDMAPATINAGSFTLTGPGLTPVVGAAIPVTYAVGSRTATFTPAAALAPSTTYTATIKGTGASPATDTVILANALAGISAAPLVANDYVWTFTTAAAPIPPVPVTAVINTPLAGAINVCPSATIIATFSAPMDAIPTTAAFTLADAALNPIAGTAVLDVTLKIATFTPLNPLVNGTTYTATIKGGATGVKDLAVPANTMTANLTRSFTAGPATGACLPPVNLGRASTFGIAATAGVTNTGTLPNTNIHGDVVLDPTATCNAVAAPGGAGTAGFGACGGFAPALVGTVVTPASLPAGTSTGVKTDLLAAFLSITPPAGPPAAGTLPGGTPIAAPTTLGAVGAVMVPGQNYFTPGVYMSNTSIMITNDLTLDAQGNPNAVFVFQSASTIGTAAGAAPPGGVHTRILLIGGAKASNVWWQAGTSATLGLYSEFQGNILASASITMGTGSTSCGRLLAGAFTAGAFVFDSNVVSVPGQPFVPPATYSAICQ
jgi:hypothetical protein